MTLEDTLKWARELSFEPPMFYAEGQEWHRYKPAELSKMKADLVARAEDYAKWRHTAYLKGECVSPW